MTETLNNTGETPNSGNTEEVVYPPFNPQNAAAEKQKRMEERAQHAADNGYKHAAIAFGNIAESYEQRAHEKEEEAGAAQEANQELSTTEDYKAQYPNAVEDIDKAHAMALAGDEDETKAASLRKRAQHAADNGYKHAAIAFGNIAESHEQRAHEKEEEAGATYDNMQNS